MKKPGKEKVRLEETFFCWINHKCTLPFHHAHELKYLKTRLFLPPTPAWNTGEFHCFLLQGRQAPVFLMSWEHKRSMDTVGNPQIPTPQIWNVWKQSSLFTITSTICAGYYAFVSVFIFFETESHWVDCAVTKQLRYSAALPPKCWESRFLPQLPALGCHFLSFGLECLFLPLFFPSQMFFSSHAMQRDVLREKAYTTLLFPSLNKEMKS